MNFNIDEYGNYQAASNTELQEQIIHLSLNNESIS